MVHGTPYYKYMLVYVIDVLHLAQDAKEYMLKIKQIYRLKEGFGTPDKYLGDNGDRFQLQDGRTVWSMHCVEYLRGAINNVDQILEGNQSSPKSFGDVHHTYPSSYIP